MVTKSALPCGKLCCLFYTSRSLKLDFKAFEKMFLFSKGGKALDALKSYDECCWVLYEIEFYTSKLNCNKDVRFSEIIKVAGEIMANW